MKSGGRRKLIALLLSLAMIVAMTPLMATTAFADGEEPPTNLRWEGKVAKWDPVDGADRFFIYLLSLNEETGEDITLNSGGTFYVEPGATEKDFTDAIEYYGAGKYRFMLGYYMNDKDYYFLDVKSPYNVVPNKYTVTFDANGGSGTMKSSGTVSGIFEIPKCTFTAPAGKQFDGWAYTANGQIITESKVTLTKNTTLYAIWKDKIVVNEIKLSDYELEMDNDYPCNEWDIEVSFDPEGAYTDYEWTSSNPNVTIQKNGHVKVLGSAKHGEKATLTVKTVDGLNSATCIVTVRDRYEMLEGNNFRWEGNVAKWDPVDGADKYFIYLFKEKEETGEDECLNNGSTFYVEPGTTERDFTDALEYYGPGKYKYEIGFYKKGMVYYFTEFRSPVYDYKGPHQHSYTEEISPATTSQDGSLKEVCKECGDVKSEVVIPQVSQVALSTTSYTYNGNAKSPSLTVKDSEGTALKNGTDYTVTNPSGRKNVGTYTYKITFKGNYSGTISKSFVINPKGATIKTPTKAKKAFTAKWSKQSTKMSSSRITGYQVQYSTSKSFSGAKTVSVKGYTKASKKISKLKAKTTYYVKVRTYMNVSGKTYYSSWSKVKSVKTK